MRAWSASIESAECQAVRPLSPPIVREFVRFAVRRHVAAKLDYTQQESADHVRLLVSAGITLAIRQSEIQFPLSIEFCRDCRIYFSDGLGYGFDGMGQLPSAAIFDRHNLTESQRLFVASLLEGIAPMVASERAGFKGNSWPYLMRVPAIKRALHECVQADLLADSPTNLKVLRKIRDDASAPKGVRADIALKLMRLAGHIEPAAADSEPVKQLSEMSAEELRQYIERNQAEIDRIEGELAARAIDVSTPVIDPDKPGADAKSLDYLD